MAIRLMMGCQPGISAASPVARAMPTGPLSCFTLEWREKSLRITSTIWPELCTL